MSQERKRFRDRDLSSRETKGVEDGGASPKNKTYRSASDLVHTLDLSLPDSSSKSY
jgi:hypothetical protein